MKTIRATLMALALLALMALPALAGGKPPDGKPTEGVDITISVSCTTNPEQVSIANNLRELPISIVEISSIDDPRENEPFFIGEEIGPGETITFESGDAADENVLTNQFIFDNENLENEGVIVRIGPEPILDDFEVGCNQSPETFEVLGDDDQDDDEQETPQMPDTGAGGMSGGAGLPIGNIAAAGSLLAAGAYAMRRRR